jgi:hypothetical protein
MNKRKKKSFITGARSLRVVRHYFPNVTEVLDGTKPALVEVTKEDNAHADVKKHRTCALAIASKRYFKADGVIVGLSTSYIIFGNTAYRYFNAGTTSREITSFDRKAGFDCGFYHLTPPSPASRIGAEKKTRADRPSGARTGTSLKGYRHYTKGVRTTLGHIGIS